MIRAILVLALVLAVAVGVVACSSEADNILGDAGEYGNINFPSKPHVVSAQRILGAGGDMLIQLVVDIPSDDTRSFKDRSGLTSFAPGVPHEWVQSYWVGSDLADAVRATGQSEVEYANGSIEIPGHPVRLVVIRKQDATETRVYITLMR